MSKRHITAEEVRRLFNYNPYTGIFTRRIDRPPHKAGEIAGYNCHGYIRIKITNQTYSAHRLAWLYVYGACPVGEIDHINGNCSDNRISNLRDVSHMKNCENKRKARADNKSGLLGVSKADNSWRAQIQVNGKKFHIGVFETKEEAHLAYIKAKRSLHTACSI